jgi:hypothetical protein
LNAKTPSSLQPLAITFDAEKRTVTGSPLLPSLVCKRWRDVLEEDGLELRTPPSKAAAALAQVRRPERIARWVIQDSYLEPDQSDERWARLGLSLLAHVGSPRLRPSLSFAFHGVRVTGPRAPSFAALLNSLAPRIKPGDLTFSFSHHGLSLEKFWTESATAEGGLFHPSHAFLSRVRELNLDYKSGAFPDLAVAVPPFAESLEKVNVSVFWNYSGTSPALAGAPFAGLRRLRSLHILAVDTSRLCGSLARLTKLTELSLDAASNIQIEDPDGEFDRPDAFASLERASVLFSFFATPGPSFPLQALRRVKSLRLRFPLDTRLGCDLTAFTCLTQLCLSLDPEWAAPGAGGDFPLLRSLPPSLKSLRVKIESDVPVVVPSSIYSYSLLTLNLNVKAPSWEVGEPEGEGELPAQGDLSISSESALPLSLFRVLRRYPVIEKLRLYEKKTSHDAMGPATRALVEDMEARARKREAAAAGGGGGARRRLFPRGCADGA